MSDEEPDPECEDGPSGSPREHWKRIKEKHEPSNNSQRGHFGWQALRRHVDIVAVRKTGELYAYEDGIWKNNGEQALRERAQEVMGADYHTGVLRELKDRVRGTATVQADQMGAPAGKLPIRNGLLDLEDRSLRDLRPEDYALHRHPVEFDPGADCPRWRSFLDQVTDGEAAAQLQEFVGYCLVGGEPVFKKALMILGPTDAGKTVFLEVVESLFGEHANAGQTPQYLANQRWGVDQLFGKPVNIRHDVDTSKIQSLGILKEIIDGNTVTAEQKGKDPYQFEPETRLLFAANQPPRRTRDDEAFWNRWLTVVFPESVPPEEQIPKRELMNKLTDELPGILNWAIDGLHRLRENDGFTAEQSPNEVRRVWEQYGTAVERFKIAHLEKNRGEAVPKEDVRRAFRHFCRENDHENLSHQKLTTELTKDPAIGETQKRVNGGRPRAYTGVRLTEDMRERLDGTVLEGESTE